MEARATDRPARKRGHALMTTVLVVSSLLMVGSALMALTSTSGRSAAHRMVAAQAQNLAIAGVDYTVAQLRLKSSYAGFAGRSFGPGTFSAAVSPVTGQPNWRAITAVATVQRAGISATRTVRQTVDIATSSKVFTATVASQTDLSITGNVTITSAPTAHQAWVHSNGDLSLGGSVDVDGSATASGTLSGGSHASSSQGSAASLEFPEITLDFKEQSIEDNGALPGPLTINDLSPLPGKVTGDLTISGAGATIDGVCWVTGNLRMSGPLSGVGTIVCDGTIDATTGGTPPALSNVAIITTSTSPTALSLGGNGQFRGLLYAPNGGVLLHGNPDYYGSILAQTVAFHGTPTITRWTGFATSPPLPVGVIVKGWQAL